MSDLSNALRALRIANKRIDELEKYNLDLANESHNKTARIEQLQQRVGELELKYEGKNLVWFEREEVGALDPEQTGFVSLAEVRANQAAESFMAGQNSCGVDPSWSEAQQHANKIRNGKDGEL